MKAQNPFRKPHKTTYEVIIKSCTDCRGTGSIKDDDGDEILCSKCNGSGEITEKNYI